MSGKKRITKLAFALHSWMGMFTGVFLLLLGLSGSVLVFKEELDYAVNKELLNIKLGEKKHSLDDIYRMICERHPNLAGIAWLNPDAPTHRAYEFRLYQNDGQLRTYDLGMMSINPYNGKVLREGNLTDLSTGALHWLVQFHWCFQLGIPGLLLATILGLTMILSVITGLVIYRKYVWKVLLFRVKFKWRNRWTISSALHRSVGVWAMVFNIVLFFTGFWMNMFSMQPSYWAKQTVSAPKNVLAVQSIDSMLLTAKQTFPDLLVRNIYLPTQPDKNFRISGVLKDQSAIFYNGNSVSVDPQSGEVIDVQRLAVQPLFDRITATFFPLHTGSFGHTIVKICYVILGLLPGILSVTGVVLWWRKRRSYRKKR
ncbi:PepSY-associated TM helix domain-containing protein [Sphingobacterium chungjuense]|uniref:PepSY-associated TM helix domain-containing protein n=1 Tax=Sphingobacterium chungjuense TaxID=2675553 RepID=UPI001408E125|nr:PepSY-associated TM helix domain-containing protein [Sphingobacterium chungjuense]